MRRDRRTPRNANRPAGLRAGWVVAVLGLSLLGGADSSAQEAIANRFRVTFDAPEPAPWTVELVVPEGELLRLQPLSLDPHAAAAASLRDGRVVVRHRDPLARDALDVTARRAQGAELLVRLLDSHGDPLVEQPASLDAALESPQSVRLGESGPAVTLTRIASDRLRVESDRESLLFKPGERFTFDVLTDPEGVAEGEEYVFTASLARGRAGEEVWKSEPAHLTAGGDTTPRTPVAIPLPNQEGVYRVRLAATRPARFLSRFQKGASEKPLTERTFQVVVLDPRHRPPAPGDWRETYAFDPRSQRWADRVPEWMRWRRLPWFATGPKSSEDHPDRPKQSGGAIEIAPHGESDGAHWRAYPLPLDQPGAVYAVEVESLGEPGDRLTLAVLEPDAWGDLRPLTAAVTHVAPRWDRDAPRPTVRLMLRPRTTSPLLVLANPSADRPARFGKIRLLRSTGVATATPTAPGRTLALSWADTDLPHTLGASHAASSVGRHEHPDLQTFYETAIALADRVEAAGAGSAVIPVNESGGAIYPSRHWTSPRFDLGAWSDGTADLPRRELLSLIAHEFARRDLRLLPAVRFDAPVPEGVADGRRHEIVEELLDAIGLPGVTAGVAVRLSPSGWDLLATQAADAYSGAAPRRLRASYEQLAATVRQRLPETAPLLLLPGELPQRRGYSDAFTPRLGPSQPRAATAIELLGLGELATAPRSLLLATPHAAASGGALDGALEAVRSALPPAETTGPRSLVSNRDAVRLAASATRLRRATDSSAHDVLLPAVVIEPTAESALLANAAAEGATIVLLDGAGPAGLLDDRLVARRENLQKLPIGAKTTVPPSDAARQADVVTHGAVTAGNESLIAVTNRSPWRRTARLTVNAPNRTRGWRADDLKAKPAWFEAGRHAVEIELEAFQTAAWRFADASVTAEGVRIDPAPAAQRELAEAVADLQTRDTTRRRRNGALPNGSFEQANPSDAHAAPLGWSGTPGVRRDATVAYDGDAAVRLEAEANNTAVLLSDPFPMPETGQLVLLLRVRPGELADDSELRLEIEQAGGAYRSGTRLTGAQLQTGGAEPDWLPPLVFPVDDLPLTDGGRLRVRFTLAGQGSLYLDDLQAEDLLLPLDGYGSIELRSEKFALVRLLSAAEDLLAEGRLEACRSLLDGYWARFLMDNFPAHQPAPVASAEPGAAETAEAEPADEESPSIGKRLRGYLPRWWR